MLAAGSRIAADSAGEESCTTVPPVGLVESLLPLRRCLSAGGWSGWRLAGLCEWVKAADQAGSEFVGSDSQFCDGALDGL